MTRKTLLILLLIVNFTTYAQNKKVEKELYQLAKKNKNSKTYLEYFNKYYPNGYYIEKAQKKGDDIVYTNAIENKNYLKLCLYQKYFPNGLHIKNIENDKNNVAEFNLSKVIESETKYYLNAYISNHKGATKQIKVVEEKIAFIDHKRLYQETVSNWSYPGLYNFIKLHEKSIYYDKVIEKLFNVIVDSKNSYEYKRFLNLKRNKYTQQIRNKLEAYNNEKFAETEKTIKGYEDFIKYNKDNSNIERAKKELTNLLDKDKKAFEFAKNTNTFESYNNYLNYFPQGKFIGKVKILKSDLPLVSNIKAVANGNKIDIYFYVNIENTPYIYENITNSNGIAMNNIVGDKTYIKSGNYRLTWDVLKDTDALEGNISFDISVLKKKMDIKSDLIGKKIPGWNFDYLKEFKEFKIIKTLTDSETIKYHIKLKLLDERKHSYHESEVIVTYSILDSNLLFKNVRMLYITYINKFKKDTWKKITPIKDCNFDFENNYRLTWKVGTSDESTKFHTGPNSTVKVNKNYFHYYIKSKDENEINVVFTYTPK
jgi:hypothetical protein